MRTGALNIGLGLADILHDHLLMVLLEDEAPSSLVASARLPATVFEGPKIRETPKKD
jgi:hypothetical protein